MAVLDLRRQAAREGLTLDGAPPLTERDRLSAIATWRGRMVNEHISARVFAALVPQMMAAEIDPDRQAAVAGMIAEELRHAVLCAAAVHALGGEARAELPPLAAVPLHEDAEPIEALLRNVLSISCLSETVAVALIGAERLATTPPQLSEALKTILGDEVGHARFGWALLDELAPRIDAAMRERLGNYLVAAFKHLAEHELAHLPPRPAPSAQAEEVGVCDGNDARQLFFKTVNDVIVPGLEKRGLPGAAAWQAASRQVST